MKVSIAIFLCAICLVIGGLLDYQIDKSVHKIDAEIVENYKQTIKCQNDIIATQQRTLELYKQATTRKED